MIFLRRQQRPCRHDSGGGGLSAIPGDWPPPRQRLQPVRPPALDSRSAVRENRSRPRQRLHGYPAMIPVAAMLTDVPEPPRGVATPVTFCFRVCGPRWNALSRWVALRAEMMRTVAPPSGSQWQTMRSFAPELMPSIRKRARTLTVLGRRRQGQYGQPTMKRYACPSLRPSPCAMKVSTMALSETPSAFARVASCAWMVLGTRAINLPDATPPLRGKGTGTSLGK